MEKPVHLQISIPIRNFISDDDIVLNSWCVFFEPCSTSLALLPLTHSLFMFTTAKSRHCKDNKSSIVMQLLTYIVGI